MRVDFHYTRRAEVGYAVLSFTDIDRITSLIAEVLPRRAWRPRMGFEPMVSRSLY